MNFQVKRRWWIWAIAALWHIFASCFLRIGIWQVIIAVIILDFILVFPEIHLSYNITNRQFTVKRIGYSDVSFPCNAITAVENATLFTMWGGRNAYINMNQIVSESLGAYRITYITDTENHKRKAVIVSPKNRQDFLTELSLNVDPKVILVNNTESAFKKKKDEV